MEEEYTDTRNAKAEVQDYHIRRSTVIRSQSQTKSGIVKRNNTSIAILGKVKTNN